MLLVRPLPALLFVRQAAQPALAASAVKPTRFSTEMAQTTAL